MKKIPSLFLRDFDGDRSRVTREVNPECAWVIAGEGVPTRKRDGTACLVRDGKLYRRYDAKHGKTPPQDFDPCQEEDPVTGHRPGWIPVKDGPEDRWYRSSPIPTEDGTYELCGPKFQTNAEHLEAHTFFRHGSELLTDVPLTWEGLSGYFVDNAIEGVVWHHPDGRMAKIKAKDFGIAWPDRSQRTTP
jgi:hypothetical protein